MLKLPENIVRLRKEKKITQDVLADIMGVTKASVSKWETGQCMPDIMLLPRLAAYFDVSIDTLIGYNPQLSKEQIRKIYHDFTAKFASSPFDKVIVDVRELVKQYYSCYPLLLQICVLYLNHAQLAGGTEQILAVFAEARELTQHIIDNCTVPSVCSDAISVKAVLDLQLGKIDDVINALEPILDPERMSEQSISLLIQAYSMAGMNDKAVDFIQITLYTHLLTFVGLSTQYLAINAGNCESCYATMRRIDSLADAYNLCPLNPNIMAQFSFQAAITCLAFGDEKEALKRLDMYAECIKLLFQNFTDLLHGDDYFYNLDKFFSSLALGANPPRDRSLIKQSAINNLVTPALQSLADKPELKKIIKKIEEIQ